MGAIHYADTEKSLQNKLFFMDIIKDIDSYDLIVEFGCGDGVVINRVSKLLNHTPDCWGYDINPEVVEVAKHHNHKNLYFTNNFDDIMNKLSNYNKTLIIFSSALHELEQEVMTKLLYQVMNNFTTVVIRDMKRPLNQEPISYFTRGRIKRNSNPKIFKSFEERWGRIDNKYNMYLYFLKYNYTDAWDKELEEDYFSVPWSDISDHMRRTHKTIYERSYTLEFLRKQVRKLFSHTMHDITHREIIYTKNNKEE